MLMGRNPRSDIAGARPDIDARAGNSQRRSGLSIGGWWGIAAAVLGLYFLAWWLHLRPGIFSYDSGFYLDEVRSGFLSNRKPFLYARFLQLVTLNGAALQLACVVQSMLVVLALSRAFAIAVVSRVRIGWIALCALLVLNPYVAGMVFYVQNDTLFSVALVAMTVETLHVARQRRASIASCMLFALFAPMALLFRQNGIGFLPLWIIAILLLMPRRAWVRVLVPAVAASALAFTSIIGVSTNSPEDHQDMLYPAVIHEVVNLARPGYHVPLGQRLAPETQALVGPERLAQAVQFYWPLYWDTIAFFPDGPMLIQLPPQQRSRIVRSFLRHDLFANVQAVLAHRLEIFVGACLARAEPVGPYDVPANLPADVAAMKGQRVARMQTGLLHRIEAWSMATRGWSWNALFGVIVLAALSLSGLWKRDLPLVLCSGLLWVQAGLILVAAPSAEYRYVFSLYLAPLLLLAGDAVDRGFRARHRHLPGARAPIAADADSQVNDMQDFRRP